MKRAFTLIELILVVAIVAVLAGAMIPMITSARERARAARVIMLYDSLRTASQKFHADTGRIPTEFGPSVNSWDHQLFESSAFPHLIYWPQPGIGQPIPGWDGPYIPRRISLEDNPTGNVGVFMLSVGPNMGRFYFLLANCPENLARRVNDALDNNEPGAWDSTGYVIHNGANQLVIEIFIAKL